MNSESEHVSSLAEEDYARYRALSLAAVVALALGVVSLLGLFFSSLLFIPLIGFGLSIYALRSLRRHGDEYAGAGLARAGMLLSILSFFGGVARATTVYVTEVPEGYQRIGFSDLQPDPQHPNLPVSPKAMELNGEKVFVKGYMYPSDQYSELKKFVLVRDMGTCCFGGQPPLTHMIEVTLRDPLRARFSYRKMKLGGTLKVDTKLKQISGLEGVYFQLDADYLK